MNSFQIDISDKNVPQLNFICFISLFIELTFAVVITCKEGEEPDLTPVIDYTKYDGKKMPQVGEREPVSIDV